MASIAKTDERTSNSSLGSYPFAGCAIGTGNGNRTIFACSFVRNTANGVTIPGITADGQAMTVVGTITANSTANGSSCIAFYRIKASAFGNPNASAVDMTVTPSSTCLRCALVVRMTSDDIETAAFDLASDKNDVTGGSPQTLTLDLDVPAGGIVLGLAEGTQLTGSGGTIAWSGLTGDTGGTVGTTVYKGADASNVLSATPRAVSATLTFPANIVAPAGLVVAFAPIIAPIVGGYGSGLSLSMGLHL
jgi:hypothetical protein